MGDAASSDSLSDQEKARESEPVLDLARLERLYVSSTLGAGLVHDLRNLLAVVESSAFLASKNRADTEKLDVHLRRLTDHARRAQQILDAIMQMTKNEGISLTSWSLEEVVSRAKDEVVFPDGLTPRLMIEPSLQCLCHPSLLERAFVNLLGNAACALHGTENPSLEVVAHRESEHIVVRVSDNGPGLPPEMSDPFVGFRSSREGGTGLGLLLVRAVIGAHGGTIDRAPTPAGTSFEIRLRAPG